jgi:hypothetical protein
MSRMQHVVTLLDQEFPNVERAGDGVAFVASPKPSVAGAKDRYAEVPVLVLPLVGDTQYALFRTRLDFELLDSRRIPFADASSAERKAKKKGEPSWARP